MRWMPTERVGELVITGVLFCIGLFSVLMSRDMPKGEFSVPGPGFYPTILGFVMCSFSIALGIRVFLYYRTTKRVEIGHPYIWFTTVALIIVAILFERIGFIPMIALFIVFLLRILSHLRWVSCILWAIAGAVTAYLLFDLLLGVQLPSIFWF